MTRSPRWLVPVAALALIGGGVAAASASTATPDLPARTSAELLAAVASADVAALSATVRTESDLGLPSLGGLGGGASAGADSQSLLTGLLAGDTTIRVWTDGPDRFRAAIVDDSGELLLVRNDREVWTYSSAENAATRVQLPAEDSGRGGEQRSAPEALTPDELATQALEAADPTTEVTVGDNQEVAGRDAYTLVVTPRTEESLVDRIEIAVDAESSLPVQVQVFAEGQDGAAFSTGFTSLDLSVPDASLFDFAPPADATVTEGWDGDFGDFGDGDFGDGDFGDGDFGDGDFGSGDSGSDDDARGNRPAPSLPTMAGMPRLLGEGWATVLELPAPDGALIAPDDTARDTAGDGAGAPDATAMFDQLTQPVEGGRAITTALLSVLLTDDGRVLVGAVPVDTLLEVAESQ